MCQHTEIIRRPPERFQTWKLMDLGIFKIFSDLFLIIKIFSKILRTPPQIMHDFEYLLMLIQCITTGTRRRYILTHNESFQTISPSTTHHLIYQVAYEIYFFLHIYNAHKHSINHFKSFNSVLEDYINQALFLKMKIYHY